METKLRASLVAAGAATVLSAFVGVIRGVDFFTLFLRAIVGGLCIGAGVFGAILLLQKMVPGLFSKAQDATEPEDFHEIDAQSGTNVDIVLPGDESLVDYPDPSPRGEPSLDLHISSPKNGSGRVERMDEATELLSEEEASLLEPEGNEGDSQTALPLSEGAENHSSGSVDDLDVLPDLEGYSDSFTSSEFASSGSASNNVAKGYNGQGGSTSRPGQEGFDPASLAQAVRTILKRDQKG